MVVAQEREEKKSVAGTRWYIVHAYTNFERKVADAIRERAKAGGLEDLFEEIVVPTEEVVEVKRGRKIPTERKFLPGYVLVKMKMTDQAFVMIKNTPKVTGFLGADYKPMPIPEDEALRILNQVKEGVERPRPTITFDNQTMMYHPIHLHGHTFQLIKSDGTPGARKDTVIVLPKQKIDAVLVADNPGLWMLHCHNTYHAYAGMQTRLDYVF